MNFTVKSFDELQATELYEILKSRAEVFLLEQNIVCQDMDDVDYESYHFFIKEGSRIIAYLRAYYTDKENKIVKIGRVLTLSHGNGIGRELMNNTVSEIKHRFDCKKVIVSAQKQAEGFYKKCGFKTVSGEFMEEGIPHVKMEMEI